MHSHSSGKSTLEVIRGDEGLNVTSEITNISNSVCEMEQRIGIKNSTGNV